MIRSRLATLAPPAAVRTHKSTRPGDARTPRAFARDAGDGHAARSGASLTPPAVLGLAPMARALARKVSPT
ncbi:hypothetical protein [Streptomyces doebereineriae]|uniref:Uncharacterized protein n=1 Tax=Streptomyces doebereineriae TaxID=3075528 RepID=A0ABU2VNN0_9ACTN|nr:hypothetical protein [Streptomyces sp. DSM 41640]MDT0487223.1 hypothetical protein [Streptomyces sp. DSM 41640]